MNENLQSNGQGTNEIFKRVMERKMLLGYTWDEIACKAGIQVSSWMTGVPYCEPTDEELVKLAPVLKTTYKWLKYGIK